MNDDNWNIEVGGYKSETGPLKIHKMVKRTDGTITLNKIYFISISLCQ